MASYCHSCCTLYCVSDGTHPRRLIRRVGPRRLFNVPNGTEKGRDHDYRRLQKCLQGLAQHRAPPDTGGAGARQSHHTDAWLRLQCSPNYTAIIAPRDTVTNPKPERHPPGFRSPLMRLGRATKDTLLRRIEKLQPFVVPPWWEPTRTHIYDDAEAVRKAHSEIKRRYPNDMRIYTDGSGIDGRIGAAAYNPPG